MKKDLQISIIKELMSQLDEGRNVDAGVQFKMPTDSYVCPKGLAESSKNFPKSPTAYRTLRRLAVAWLLSDH